MKLLLDTHIWLWSLFDPGRLRQRVSRELENSRNEIWLSPISVWETLILARKGRFILHGKPENWIRDALLKGSLKEARLTHEIAIRSCALSIPHNDPADRFLAATAIFYGLTLVTADKRLLRCRGFSTLANK